MEKKLEALHAELWNAVQYLMGMIQDIDAGNYSRMDAVADLDALQGSKPLGFMFALGEFADTYDGGDE